MEPKYSEIVHQKYSAQVGSEQIALLISIQTLIKLLETKKPSQVIELGSGIGTLTEVCLEQSNAKIMSVENNDWCVSRLKHNLHGLRPFQLVTDYSELNVGSSADLLVIDANNGIYNVESLVRKSTNLQTIFIEGHHLAHRINICKVLHQTLRRQSLVDVREKRGMKGCAYFEIGKDSSFLNYKSHLDFILTFTPLKLGSIGRHFRKRIGTVLDKLERIPGFRLLRQKWKGKIPWSF